MDQETKTGLCRGISVWCERNAKALLSIEKGAFDSALARQLFEGLDGLGVLHVLAEAEEADALAMVAETANALALHSPSMALLVVQQNMAASILAAARAAMPTGWVALPLYDCPDEWPHLLQIGGSQGSFTLNGTWGSLPTLPIAETAILPVVTTGPEGFAWVHLDIGKLPPNTHASGPIPMLGLRGCPTGDLKFTGANVSGNGLLMHGATAGKAAEALWSQAEICMQAIRAAVLERCYAVAHEHASVRWQGGKIILEHTLIRKMLADLYLAKHVFDDAWRRSVAAVSPGQPLTAGQMGDMLRGASDLPRLTSIGIQLLGGSGYMEDFPQERLFRDAKQCELLLGRPQLKVFSAWPNPAV